MDAKVENLIEQYIDGEVVKFHLLQKMKLDVQQIIQ